MKTKSIPSLAVLCGLSIALHAQTPPLMPFGPPSDPSTAMKSLDQVEPRTPIGSLPFTISAPGSYYLIKSLEFGAATGDAITIAADRVTLDLQGFTLSSTATVTGSAIARTNAFKATHVKNGFIAGTTEVGTSGSFPTMGWSVSPGGFQHGVSLSGGSGVISGLQVSGCRSHGISGADTVTESSVTANGGSGVTSAMVVSRVQARKNYESGINNARAAAEVVVEENRLSGITGQTLVGGIPVRFDQVTAQGNGGSGIVFRGGIVSHCLVYYNQASGISGTTSSGFGGVISHCTALGNVDIGIQANDHAITSCVASGNAGGNITGTGQARSNNLPAP
jgi:hypothetical protein